MPGTAIATFQLPDTLPRDRAVELDLVEGVLIFRASQTVRDRIETLLEKQQALGLTEAEELELSQYEELDDYLSLQNRLARNYFLTQQEKAGG
ncbi:MAG: hypothetical protein JNK38_11580 [Acidobacteria bacterium]|nr:hypothetical protein [Acidobacteriota bacterium]